MLRVRKDREEMKSSSFIHNFYFCQGCGDLDIGTGSELAFLGQGSWIKNSFIKRLLITLVVFFAISPAYADKTSVQERMYVFNEEDSIDIELGEGYDSWHKGGRSSGDSTSKTTTRKNEETSFARKALLYIPNRVCDAFDFVKADLGVGFALGAVARITKWGQVGLRSVNPISVRAGLRGRHIPVFIEHSSEVGIGPLFLQSNEREVTPAEIGVGIDLFLIGAYAGISLDETFDLIAGIFGFDPKEDDFQ